MSHPFFARGAAVVVLVALAGACSTTADRSGARSAVSAEWFESLPSERHVLHVDTLDELPGFESQAGGVACAGSRSVAVQPFVRLVASCNARVGAGGAFALDVRVRERADGPWSPWCTLQSCGDSARVSAGVANAVSMGVSFEPATDTVRFDGGRVAVDEVLLDREHQGFEYRVVAAGDVELVHVCVCTSAAPRASDASASFDPSWRPERAVRLDVVPRSQKSQSAALAPRVCSPTSLAMVLDWHGVDVPTADVAERVFDRAHDIFGNWPRNVQGAFELGVPALLVRYDSWDAVYATLARGLPIVASIGVAAGQLDGAPYATTSGHLIVVRGIDANGDVLVADPAAPPSGPGADAAAPDALRTYRRDQLQQVWMERGGTAYVLLGR